MATIPIKSSETSPVSDKSCSSTSPKDCINRSLLGNAVKFTEKGHILVRSQVEELPRDTKGRKFRFHITVEDTGIGIPRDKFELLFRAFSQIDNSNKRSHGGTGLGLAICEKLVHLMGGKIWVESQEGVGTHFHFGMVLNAVDETPSPPPGFVRDVPVEERRCLVIEHSGLVREMLSRDIAHVGLEGDAVGDFREARKLLGSTRYGVIIVDGSLLGSEDFDKEVGRLWPSTRLVMTSNLGMVVDFDDFNFVTTLMKPIRRWRLIQAVERSLNKSPIVDMK